MTFEGLDSGNSLCHGESWCHNAAGSVDNVASPRTFHLLPNFNVSEVNMPAFIDVVFGSETWWEILAFVLVLNTFRSFGLIASGFLYYLILGSTTDPDRRAQLETLDFVFNENTLATNSVVNIFAWFLLITGRFTLSMIFEGPTRTFLGIRDFDLDRILRFLIPPSRSVPFLWRVLFESFGLVFGWTVFAIIGTVFYGPGDGKRKRKRRRRDVKQSLRDFQQMIMSDRHLHHLLEERMNQIFANVDDGQILQMLRK